MQNVQVLQVGKPYSTQRSRWPEGSQLYLSDPTVLVLFMEYPTAGEIEAVFSGTARFAWSQLKMSGLLSYSFEPGMPWSEANFTPHRNVDGDVLGNNLTETPPTMHHGITVVLVCAATGIVKALRMLSWEAKFAEAVRRSVQKLAEAPFDAAASDRELAELEARFPGAQGAKLLVQRYAIATCRGGVAATDN